MKSIRKNSLLFTLALTTVLGVLWLGLVATDAAFAASAVIDDTNFPDPILELL